MQRSSLAKKGKFRLQLRRKPRNKPCLEKDLEPSNGQRFRDIPTEKFDGKEEQLQTCDIEGN